MYKLLTINGFEIPDADGDLQISESEKINEYQGEDGHTTIEEIRQGIISLSVSFDVLSEDMLNKIKSTLSIVSTVDIYNPLKKETETRKMKVSGIKVKRVCYKQNTSLWSLSFNLDEL